jgi:hypothetical protein
MSALPAFDHLVRETVACRRFAELILHSGCTLLISQNGFAKGQVEKEYFAFSRFLESNNQATESQMNAGLTRIALLEALSNQADFAKNSRATADFRGIVIESSF